MVQVLSVYLESSIVKLENVFKVLKSAMVVQIAGIVLMKKIAVSILGLVISSFSLSPLNSNSLTFVIWFYTILTSTAIPISLSSSPFHSNPFVFMSH